MGAAFSLWDTRDKHGRALDVHGEKYISAWGFFRDRRRLLLSRDTLPCVLCSAHSEIRPSNSP
jgi:hypothetical protein